MNSIHIILEQYALTCLKIRQVESKIAFDIVSAAGIEGQINALKTIRNLLEDEIAIIDPQYKINASKNHEPGSH